MILVVGNGGFFWALFGSGEKTLTAPSVPMAPVVETAQQPAPIVVPDTAVPALQCFHLLDGVSPGRSALSDALCHWEISDRAGCLVLAGCGAAQGRLSCAIALLDHAASRPGRPGPGAGPARD